MQNWSTLSQQNNVNKIFKNLNGAYMHFSKGYGESNPWEGIYT